MKSKLTLPGTKRLKLRYDGPVSNFAFKFNVHRYKMALFIDQVTEEQCSASGTGTWIESGTWVRRCRLTL